MRPQCGSLRLRDLRELTLTQYAFVSRRMLQLPRFYNKVGAGSEKNASLKPRSPNPVASRPEIRTRPTLTLVSSALLRIARVRRPGNHSREQDMNRELGTLCLLVQTGPCPKTGTCRTASSEPLSEPWFLRRHARAARSNALVRKREPSRPGGTASALPACRWGAALCLCGDTQQGGCWFLMLRWVP